jgi:hypothetical protein
MLMSLRLGTGVVGSQSVSLGTTRNTAGRPRHARKFLEVPDVRRTLGRTSEAQGVDGQMPGASLGAAQVGMLQALYERRIRPDLSRDPSTIRAASSSSPRSPGSSRRTDATTRAP